MAEKTLCFPTYFPDDCPPEDAIEQELCVYRYCMGEEVTEDDFLSYFQMYPDKYKGKVNAYGLSVFCNKKECIRGLMLPAQKKRFKSFASGITYINTGVIKPTPSNNIPSHYTWWLYNNVYPHTYFTICT